MTGVLHPHPSPTAANDRNPGRQPARAGFSLAIALVMGAAVFLVLLAVADQARHGSAAAVAITARVKAEHAARAGLAWATERLAAPNRGRWYQPPGTALDNPGAVWRTGWHETLQPFPDEPELAVDVRLDEMAAPQPLQLPNGQTVARLDQIRLFAVGRCGRTTVTATARFVARPAPMLLSDRTEGIVADELPDEFETEVWVPEHSPPGSIPLPASATVVAVPVRSGDTVNPTTVIALLAWRGASGPSPTMGDSAPLLPGLRRETPVSPSAAGPSTGKVDPGDVGGATPVRAGVHGTLGPVFARAGRGTSTGEVLAVVRRSGRPRPARTTVKRMLDLTILKDDDLPGPAFGDPAARAALHARLAAEDAARTAARAVLVTDAGEIERAVSGQPTPVGMAAALGRALSPAPAGAGLLTAAAVGDLSGWTPSTIMVDAERQRLMERIRIGITPASRAGRPDVLELLDVLGAGHDREYLLEVESRLAAVRPGFGPGGWGAIAAWLAAAGVPPTARDRSAWPDLAATQARLARLPDAGVRVTIKLPDPTQLSVPEFSTRVGRGEIRPEDYCYLPGSDAYVRSPSPGDVRIDLVPLPWQVHDGGRGDTLDLPAIDWFEAQRMRVDPGTGVPATGPTWPPDRDPATSGGTPALLSTVIRR